MAWKDGVREPPREGLCLRCRHRLSPFELDKQGGDIGRADSTDPTRLADGERTQSLEFLASLSTKLRDRVIVEIGRNPFFLHTTKAVDLFELAADVAVVFGLDRDLIDHVSRKARLDRKSVV